MNQPQHIAIIMDGNRRWARAQGLKIIQGHRKVARELIEELADVCLAEKIPYLTLWAFSTENWKRDKQEVNYLMDLFREMLTENIDRLHQKKIKINTIGDLSRFPQDIQAKAKQGVAKTKHNQALTLTFALNYGGRNEIIRAIKKIDKPSKITEEKLNKLLDTHDLPDPDLIIRPGGERRFSGFMLWQSEYSELYFTDVLMPDFNSEEFKKALENFTERQRRFGG